MIYFRRLAIAFAVAALIYATVWTYQTVSGLYSIVVMVESVADATSCESQ